MALIEQVFPGGNQTTSSDSFTVEQIKNAGAGTTMPWQNNRTLSSGSYTIMLEGRFVLKDGTFGAWGEVDSKSQGVDGDIETATLRAGLEYRLRKSAGSVEVTTYAGAE